MRIPPEKITVIDVKNWLEQFDYEDKVFIENNGIPQLVILKNGVTWGQLEFPDLNVHLFGKD